jgi:hypothetical protein
MEKPEIVIGDFKVKKTDAMNWQVFELRELKAGRAGTKSREGEVDWVALPAYFGTLKPAIVKVRNLYIERKIDVSSLDGLIGEIERLDAKFAKMLAKAVEKAAS